MGNITSADYVDDDLDKQGLQTQEDASTDDENLLDFSVLFEMDSLHKALLNIKDPPGNLMTRHKEPIIKWLKSLLDREETTVNIVQFVDFLSSKGASKDEAMEVFCDLDVDGEGTMNVTLLLSIVKDTDPDPIQALIPCHDLPGSLEIFLEDKNKHSGLAKSLLKFVQRNRVDSSRLTMTSLAQIHSTLEQRVKLVQGRHITLMTKEKDEEMLSGDIDEGMERTIICKCYSKVSVSSSDRNKDNLFDNRMDTHWQSNGSPRSHWIRIQMLPGVMLKELAISVSSNDDSYMPKNLVVQVGNREGSLREVKTLTIPRECTGRFVVIQNLGTEYRYVQINFRGCYSDGCDVRVRGLHVKGFRLTKEAEPSVLDTMAVWYLSIIASTAKAAMPVAPHLRTTILTQSKSALRSLPPLSLSPHSPVKPEFLTTFVVKEMDNFLTTLCLPEETFVSVDGDSLHILLSFALAHGSVNTILDTMQILLDNIALQLPLAPLLRKMEDIKEHKVLKHSECLKLSLVKCDGGQKDEGHRPDAMLTNLPNTSSNPYISELGKEVITLVVTEESKQIMKLTRVHMKVPAGDNGARAGLLFITSQDPTSEELTKKLEQYDGWTAEDYKKFKKEKEESEGTPVDEELCPIAYFEPDKDSHEVEFTPDRSMTGKYLVFKLYASVKEGVESTELKVAVHSVQVYGHKYSPDELLNLEFLDKLHNVAQLPSPTAEGGGDNVEGGVVLVRVLGFLAIMLKDLHFLYKRRKAASLDPTLITEEHLAVESLSLEKIWNLYIPLTLNQDEQMEKASFLCLQVLRSALPFIKVKRSPPPQQSTLGSKSMTESSTSPSAILTHLCGLLDAGDTHPVLTRLAQDIVVDGVLVFFPDAEARKNYLLSMLKSVLDKNQPRSWWLKFEALCHYFSTSDSHSLLGLPHQVNKENVAELSISSAHNILNTMLACAMKEGISCIENGSSTSSDLIKLISALQATAFLWCKKHLTSSDTPTEAKEQASTLLTDYLTSLEENVYCLLNEILERKEIPDSLPKLLEESLLSRVVPEMLVFLETVVEADIDKVEILHTLQRLVRQLNNLAKRLPSAFLTVNTKVLTSSEGVESVVGVWHRESPHNYENNSRVNEEFVCSAANRFVIEFDSKCHTERRYDYLEFTDASGAKHKYDGEVGSERWPKRVEFKGQRLHMHFYSDSSNNEWGYKFTLKAYGHTLPPLGWLFDLQVTLSHLLGLLCSSVLSTKQIRRALPGKKITEEVKEEEKLVHSDLWKTLFRGGSMVSKLTRSLSGAYYASSPSESKLAAILEDLVNGPEGPGIKLVEKCREEVKGQYYGGPLVDKAVSAVFAALIWHTQEIRQDLTPFACASEEEGSTGEPTLTPGLLSAFKAAESMRRELVEAKQKLMEEKEKEENEEKKAQVDEDTPVNSCHNKASFLLKFSGLTKVPTSKEDLLGPTPRPGWAQKSRKWQKVSTAVSTVGVLKQSLQTDRGSNSTEKFPSFELVLNFVGNEALSEEKVSSLLKQREESARAAAQTYGFIADYIDMSDHIGMFELPALAFLQQLLAKQRHFPKHYAAKLDGCGLELENQVRKSYRLMLTRLMETLNSFKKPPSKEHTLSRLLVQTYLTHLLDFEWQDYDYALLCELHLPDFFIESAIRSSASEDRTVVDKFEGEEAMLKRYAIHMKLLESFKKLLPGSSWRELMDSPEAQEDSKEAHLFLVCMSHSHPRIVGLQCDGCETNIKARWYRDMDYDDDLDLCTKCFENGTGSRPSGFSEDHMFQCLGKHGCDLCGMSIITHRFHSNTRSDFDLCLGCLRKEEESGKFDEWTVFLLTEHPAPATCKKFKSTDSDYAMGHLYKEGVMTKMGGAMDLMVYTQHHSWILFSFLCLTVARTVNNSITTTNGTETPVEYLSQASQIKFECLKLLAFILRAATLAKFEEADEKKSIKASEEEKEKGQETKEQDKDKAEEKVKEKEGEPSNEPSSSESAEQPEGQSSRVVADTPQSPPAAISGERETAEADSSYQDSEEDPIIAAAKQTQPNDSKISTLEKIFSILSIDRSLCLLAAILPQELSLAHWIDHKRDIEVFLTEELLPNLIQLSYCEGVSGLSRRQSLLVAVSYMARVTPKVADRAVELAQGEAPSSSVDPGENTYGLKTAQFLFAIGAKFLKKSDFAGATMCAECLLLLSQAPPWKLAISLTVNQYLQTSPQDMDLSSVFALLVIAGFPRLPREGSILSSPSSDEKPERVLLVSLGEGGSGSAVDVNKRLPVTVKLSDYKVEDTLRGCVEGSRLSTLVPLLKTSIHLAKQESDRLVEDTWILSLVMKALHVMLKSDDAENVIKGLLDKGLVAPIVQLASKPTHFSLKWRLDDLEVLGISSYSPAAPKEEGEKEKETETKESGDKKEGEEGKESSPGAGGEGKEGEEKSDGEEVKKKELTPEQQKEKYQEAILEGLPEEVKDMLKMMAEVFMCKLSVLRAAYDHCDGEMPRFMSYTEQYYDDGFKPPDEIMEAAKKWEPETIEASEKTKLKDGKELTEDMGVTRLTPVEVDMKSIEALPEDTSIFKKPKLINDSSKVVPDKEVLSRQDSYMLLRGELTKLKSQGKPQSREEICRTLQGIVVLRARQVLAALLSHWPASCPRLSTSFLGCVDITQYFCLLDLMLRQQNEDDRKKILATVLERGEPTEVLSLVVTAAQCMKEVAVDKKVIELKHPGQGEEKLTKTDKVVFDTASSIRVSFHAVKGKLTFASNDLLSKNCKSLTSSATSPKDTHTHHISGNTVHYKVELESVSEAKYPKCCFTITGTQPGRFETGYTILNAVLSETTPVCFSLPLPRLWTLLITVACQHKGPERIKVVRLLQELVNRQVAAAESADLPGSPSKATPKLELSALKPLWQLYTTLVKEYDEKSKSQQVLSPEIIRVFTGLFLTVENLAEAWGVSQELMVETLSKEALHGWLEKGISNVAYISIALGLENTASNAFIEAKKNYVPPAKSTLLEETDFPKDGEDSDDDDHDDHDDSSPTTSDDDTYDSLNSSDYS